jgi:hypothetical protein
LGKTGRRCFALQRGHAGSKCAGPFSTQAIFRSRQFALAGRDDGDLELDVCTSWTCERRSVDGRRTSSRAIPNEVPLACREISTPRERHTARVLSRLERRMLFNAFCGLIMNPEVDPFATLERLVGMYLATGRQ